MLTLNRTNGKGTPIGVCGSNSGAPLEAIWIYLTKAFLNIAMRR